MSETLDPSGNGLVQTTADPIAVSRQSLFGTDAVWKRTDKPVCTQVIGQPTQQAAFKEAYYIEFKLRFVRSALSKSAGTVQSFLSEAVLHHGLRADQVHIKPQSNQLIRIEVEAEAFRNCLVPAQDFAASIREEALRDKASMIGKVEHNNTYENLVWNKLFEKGGRLWKCDRDDDQQPIRHYHTVSFGEAPADKIQTAIESAFKQLGIEYSYQLDYKSTDLGDVHPKSQLDVSKAVAEYQEPSAFGITVFVMPEVFKSMIAPILVAYRDDIRSRIRHNGIRNARRF